MKKIALIGSKSIGSRELLASRAPHYATELLPLDVSAVRYIDDVWPAAMFIRAESAAALAAIGTERLCDCSAQGGMVIHILLDTPAPETEKQLSDAGIAVFSAPENHETAVITALAERLRTAPEALAPPERMLIVDDDAVELRRLRSLLSDHYRVTVVCSAIDALKFLERHTPDLILLDYSMPVCTGTTLISLLKSQDKYAAIPVFFLTGAGESSSATVLECARNGASGCILKSATLREILTSLNRYRKNSGERRRPCTIPPAR